MSLSHYASDTRADDRNVQRQRLLVEIAQRLADGTERSFAEAVRLIGALPDVRRAVLEVMPKQGAAGVQLTSDRPLHDVASARSRALAHYASQRYEISDRLHVLGSFTITFDDATLPPPEVMDWYGIVVDLVRSAAVRYCLEAQLLRTQHFELIGEIAASLVHDFNNLLTGIVGYSAIARARMTPDHPAAPALEMIDEVAANGGEIAHGLVDFARGDEGEGERVDANDIVRQTRQVTSRAVGDAIAVHIDLAANMPAVCGRRMLIQQALVNLVLNAADAIDGEGEITIRTRLLTQLPAPLELRPEPADRYLAISVTDTGGGVPPELHERIFQPFFTTKGSRGSGLGLTSVLRVAQWHGGGLHLASRTGQGSTFTMLLPIRTALSPETRELASRQGTPNRQPRERTRC